MKSKLSEHQARLNDGRGHVYAPGEIAAWKCRGDAVGVRVVREVMAGPQSPMKEAP